jgi:hypothetical protein
MRDLNLDLPKKKIAGNETKLKGPWQYPCYLQLLIPCIQADKHYVNLDFCFLLHHVFDIILSLILMISQSCDNH